MTKSDRWVKMDPVFHWTDSKIRVYALTCMIVILLVRIAHKRARANGFTHGAERMLALLSSINTAILLYLKYPPGCSYPVFHIKGARGLTDCSQLPNPP